MWDLDSLYFHLDHIGNEEFYNVELQTSGVYLSKNSLKNLRSKGLKTICLSVCDLMDSDNNMKVMGVPKDLKYNLDDVCEEIKESGLNLRICISLMDVYNDIDPKDIYKNLKELGADQVTFKTLYGKSIWLKKHAFTSMEKLKNYILFHTTITEPLPVGLTKYSVDQLGTVLNENCMNYNENGVVHPIIHEDHRLYSKWDDKGSLIF
jgi:hypothetical protein